MANLLEVPRTEAQLAMSALIHTAVASVAAGKDFRAVGFDIIKAVREYERNMRAEVSTENDRLRELLASSDADCAYCNLPWAEWSKCASGWPGCARSDDQIAGTGFGTDEWEKKQEARKAVYIDAQRWREGSRLGNFPDYHPFRGWFDDLGNRYATAELAIDAIIELKAGNP